jgi:hypothetical protein
MAFASLTTNCSNLPTPRANPQLPISKRTSPQPLRSLSAFTEMQRRAYGRHSELKQALHDRIGECASRGQYRRALERLDHVVEDPLPLFQGEDWLIKERRLAWLSRIELLRDWGKLTEALAWDATRKKRSIEPCH